MDIFCLPTACFVLKMGWKRDTVEFQKMGGKDYTLQIQHWGHLWGFGAGQPEVRKPSESNMWSYNPLLCLRASETGYKRFGSECEIEKSYESVLRIVRVGPGTVQYAHNSRRCSHTTLVRGGRDLGIFTWQALDLVWLWHLLLGIDPSERSSCVFWQPPCQLSQFS